MVDLSITARNLAQTGASNRLVISDDAITKKDGSFWHPFNTRDENKVQFTRFKAILENDPHLRSVEGASERAFSAIRKEAENGKPLTARLMAKAFLAGDEAISQFQNAKAENREKVLQKTMALVRNDDFFDSIVNEATTKAFPKLSQSAVPQALVEIKSKVLEEVRKLVAERDEAGVLGKPNLRNSDELIRTAVAKHIDTITDLALKPANEFLRLDTKGVSERLGSTLEMVKGIGQKRANAALYSSAGANHLFEQKVLRDMESMVRCMSNQTVLDLYRTTLSPDMLEFRLMLANRPHDPAAQRALADLNSWEGMIHMAVAERLEDSVGGRGQDRLAGTQLHTLAQVEKRSVNRELNYQTDSYLRGENTQRTQDPRATHALSNSGISVAQMEKVIKESELTVNMPGVLFQPDGPFIDNEGNVRKDEARLKNIFELPVGEKGTLYRERRQLIEHSELPTLVEQDKNGVNPSNHPISAALNPGRNVMGGGVKGGYGDLVLVLKDDVKERAAYTPTDSFFAYEAHVTQEGVSAMKEDIALLKENGHPDLSKRAITALKENPEVINTLFQRLDHAVGQSFGLGHQTSLEDFIADILAKDLPGFDAGDMEILLNIAAQHFIDHSSGANHVTSFDRLGQVIGNINHNAEKVDLVDSLKRGIEDPKRVNSALNGYVEAQIFGGVDLLKDVKEIRYQPHMVDDATVQSLEKLSKEYNIPLKAVKQEEKERTRLGTDESVQSHFNDLPEEVTSHQVGNLQEFREKHLSGMLDQYKGHEDTFDPKGIHGRRHISRALIYSNVLANIFREKGAAVNSDVLYSTVALHDAGRQGNGPDMWEEDSAQLVMDHYKKRGVTDQEFKQKDFLNKVDACVNSEAPSHRKTLEGAILKSVDSMDIMRVYGREGYRTDLLWFMNTDARIDENQYIMADHALRNKLLDEINIFIQETELKTPSEYKIDEIDKEYNQALVERKQLEVKGDKQGVNELDEKMDNLLMLRVELEKKSVEEHKEINQSKTSEQIFSEIESHLKNNPEKYPLLNKYYNPDT